MSMSAEGNKALPLYICVTNSHCGFLGTFRMLSVFRPFVTEINQTLDVHKCSRYRTTLHDGALMIRISVFASTDMI